jgi:hypothetical protein
MTVKELIEGLKTMPQDMEVIFKQSEPDGCFWLGPDYRIRTERVARAESQEKEGDE